MTPDLILFIVLALVAIASAAGMLMSQNTVYSALFLIVNFGTIALFYLILAAPFIALVQVTIYAGAIMVLFLFVIMLLGAEEVRRKTILPWQQPLAILLGSVLLAETIYVLVIRPGARPEAVALEPGFGSPTNIGETLFQEYLLPFEVTSILLLVAMVGAIVLTIRKERRKGYEA